MGRPKPITDSDKIYKKIEQMFDDKKTQNFLLHLIRSYFPVSNTQKVFSWEDGKDLNGSRRCAVTGTKLWNLNQIWAKTHGKGPDSDFWKSMMDNISKNLLGDETTPEESPIRKALEGGVMAYTGKNTTTFLCHDACRQMFLFITNKLMSENGKGKITWTLRQMRGDQVIDGAPIENEKKKLLKKYMKKPARVSIGEINPVLAELKSKLEQNEESESKAS